MKATSIKSLLVAVLGFSAINTHAGGVTQYFPLHASSQLEQQLEKLSAVSTLPALKKPFSVNLVKKHLQSIKDSHPVLYKNIDKYLQRYHSDFAINHAKVKLGGGSDESISNGSHKPHALANGRGETVDSNYRISSRAHYRYNDHIAVYAGVEAFSDTTIATGSMLAMGWDWAQVDIGFREHWYSPFQQQSRLIGTQAETMLSATLSNPIPFENWWNLQYEFFVAQMDTQPVLFNGRFSTDKDPFLVGTFISFQPVDIWTVSISRTFQMGGGERDTDFNDFVKAFFDPSGSDNAGFGNVSRDEEAGNQMVAFANQFKFDGKLPYVVSIEVAAEDTSKGKEYYPGNTAISAGIYFPFITEKMSLNYEFSDWQNAWYAHHLYKDGYRNGGNVLGHWASNDLQINEPLSNGQSHSISVNWNLGESTLITHVRHATYNLESYEDTFELSMEYFFYSTFDDKFSLEGTYGTDVYDEDYWQMNVGVNW